MRNNKLKFMAPLITFETELYGFISAESRSFKS